MTALAAAGTVDCSGLVSSILQRFREVGQRIAEEVKGDPGTVDAASQAQAAHAQQLAQLSQGARQRVAATAPNWDGGAHDAYVARMGRACDQLDQTATGLQAQSRTLGLAAAALRDATARMTALLQDYDGKANQLIAEAHTAAPGAVSAFVQAANTLGQSLATAAQQVREDLSRALDVLAGNDPTKPEGNDYGTKTKVDDALKKWLGDQPWFRKWYADHGWGDDPTKPKFGALDMLGSDELDELMGEKPGPTSFWGKVGENTTGTVWKWDNDGQPLWEWGAGAKGTLRTDLPFGGGAGLSGSVYAGPQVTADAKAGWEGDQLSADLNGKVTVLDAKGSAYATVGPATVQANGEGYVGANAGLNGKIGLEGASLKADAFAGAKLEGSAAGDVGGIGAGVNGSLRAGVGAELDAKATWDEGHLKVGFEAGAALGVGGSLGGSIDINVPKVWDTFEQYDPADAQLLRDGATWVGNTAHQASDAVGGAIDWLEGR